MSGSISSPVTRTGGDPPGADIAAVPQLDLKAWAALEMPVAGTAIDPASLALLDTDGDGRIRPPELCAAVLWAKASFKSLDPLLAGGDGVALANIADENLRAAAEKALALLGKERESAITLADVRAVAEKMAKDPATATRRDGGLHERHGAFRGACRHREGRCREKTTAAARRRGCG
jgi:hypothetical protein